jgi:hypothetical protein
MSFVRVYAPQADPDRAEIGIRTHGLEHMAGADLSRRTGSARGNRHTFHVKGDLRRFGLQAGKRKEARIGEAVQRLRHE